MDEIQKALIKVGRRDLAQKYYEKIAGKRRLEAVKELFKKVKLLFPKARISKETIFFLNEWSKHVTIDDFNDAKKRLESLGINMKPTTKVKDIVPAEGYRIDYDSDARFVGPDGWVWWVNLHFEKDETEVFGSRLSGQISEMVAQSKIYN